jgi:hypothetical protein
MSTTSFDESDLYTASITILTRAATKSSSDGNTDFADFLAHVLAATAANVGGPSRLVAGRPGSWESCCLDSLVRGTMGNQPNDWTWFRTQPIVVPLNVAELIEDERHHPGLMGLGEALENFDRHFDTINSDPDVDAWDEGIETISTRYTDEYRLYAERFSAAAHGVADWIPGLSADVHVEADIDPNSHWWSSTTTNNPCASDIDPLAYEIWWAAHCVAPLPNVDIWLRTGAGR